MSRRQTGSALLFLLAAVAIGPAGAQTARPSMPSKEGTCTRTRIARLEHRLQSGTNGPFIPGSGSAVVLSDGGYQVGYEELPAVTASRAGDPVLVCLVAVPKNCPPGDVRGRVYTTTNLRTMTSWTLADSEHSCGGA